MASVKISENQAVADDETKLIAAEQTGNDDNTDIQDNKEDNTDEEQESLYSQPFQNQVSVARNHPLSYYVDRSRRILRKDETLIVKGRGTTISMACTLVEVLKRQNIATINSVKTAMDIQSYFSSRGETRWTNPAPIITFELGRGKFATCVSDYHQRKVIEIFEKQECTKKEGLLPFDKLNELKLGEAFKGTDEQLTPAAKFLEAVKNDKENPTPNALDLPNFIKYASILIHPLLKDKFFKAILKESFGIDDDRKTDDAAKEDEPEEHHDHDDDTLDIN